MIVDAHVHLWRLARGDNTALLPSMVPIYRDMEPCHLKPRLDAEGVGRVVVVQAAETLAESLFLIGLSQKFPWISGIVSWIDLESPSVEEEAAALAGFPLIKGVRPVRNDNASIDWILNSGLERGLRALCNNNLALDILVQDWTEISRVTELAKNNPTQPIILNHCGKPDIASRMFDPWAEHIATLARLPNVSCKLSGLINCKEAGAGLAEIKPYADHVLESFSPRRVMWASDWPPLDLASDYPTWKTVTDEFLASLDDATREEVYSGTATRIYRL